MTKVKIPKEIKIGATFARISFKAELASDDGFNGTYNKRTDVLQIDDSLINAKRDRTLGHEVNEIIKENYDLHIDERDLTCLANGWIEFLSQLGIEFDWSLIT